MFDGHIWIDERGSDVLALPECRRLLALGAKRHLPGHLALCEKGIPTVLPIDYATVGSDVVVRVGEGLFGHIADQLVAFELEGADDGRSWSVLVRGLAIPEDPAAVGDSVPNPRVSEPGGRIVRIRSDVTTGRRVGEPTVIDLIPKERSG